MPESQALALLSTSVSEAVASDTLFAVVAEPTLPDLLGPDLRLVFCGSAAGTQSALKRAYYAGPGNRFWPVLHEVGLTTDVIAPSEYRRLLEYGIGLTDVCKGAAGMDKEIPPGAFAPDELRSKIVEFKPHILAFNGKNAARIAFGLRASRLLEYGPHDEAFGGVAVWVLPSTSRAANGTWDIQPWQALAGSLTAPAGLTA